MVKKIGCKSLADLLWRLLTIDVNEREENQSYHLEKRKQVIDKIIQFYNESDDFEVKYINFIIILGLRQYYRNIVRFD